MPSIIKTLFAAKPQSQAAQENQPHNRADAETPQAAEPQPSPFTGARRLSQKMLVVTKQADQFIGQPKGTANKLAILGAFQEAEPYLGLPAHAFKLVSWLVNKTQNQDWEAGSRPIAWPSARLQEEFMGLSKARVTSLNRALFEAGIFVMRDDPQGHRHGRRDKDGKIVEAYGFDLSPLAQRFEEFKRIAAGAAAERDQKKRGRQRITFARRALRQLGERLTAMECLPDNWGEVDEAITTAVQQARQAATHEELALIAEGLERQLGSVEHTLQAAMEASGPVETRPSGIENETLTPVNNPPESVETRPSGIKNETLTTITNGTSKFALYTAHGEGGLDEESGLPSPSRSETTSEPGSKTPPITSAASLTPMVAPLARPTPPQAAAAAPTDFAPPPRVAAAPARPTPPQAATGRADLAPPLPASTPSGLGLPDLRTVAQFLELFPRLAAYIVSACPTWPDLIDAAGMHLRVDLGIPKSLWAKACIVMGRERAALAMAIVSTKPPEHFTRGPTAYFAAMVHREERDKLHLDKSLWAIRAAKHGLFKQAKDSGNPRSLTSGRNGPPKPLAAEFEHWHH